MTSSKPTPSKNKYGFKQRAASTPKPQTPTRPTGFQKKKGPSRSKDTDYQSTLRPRSSPLCNEHLEHFRSVFKGIWAWFNMKSITRVVKYIKASYSYRGIRYSEAQALNALQDLERSGDIRMHDGTIFFPNAYHMIPAEAAQIKKEEACEES